MKLLLATRNQGKIRELIEMVDDLQVEWLSLDDVRSSLTVAENGETFEENAILKAKGYAAESGLLTLADDSGLEVDALGGRPGVHSARFGGPDLTPEQRYLLLLDELKEVPPVKRGARFHCVMALATPERLLGTADGVCEGKIALAPAGQGGFGYDPVFYLPAFQKTMAQVPAQVKRRISHRARAFAAIMPLLRQTLQEA